MFHLHISQISFPYFSSPSKIFFWMLLYVCLYPYFIVLLFKNLSIFTHPLACVWLKHRNMKNQYFQNSGMYIHICKKYYARTFIIFMFPKKTRIKLFVFVSLSLLVFPIIFQNQQHLSSWPTFFSSCDVLKNLNTYSFLVTWFLVSLSGRSHFSCLLFNHCVLLLGMDMLEIESLSIWLETFIWFRWVILKFWK